MVTEFYNDLYGSPITPDDEKEDADKRKKL